MIIQWLGHATRKAKTPISLPHVFYWWMTNMVIRMKEFIEVPANKASLAQRKLVYGIGINDADYNIKSGSNRCPFYEKWMHMLQRCYSEKYQETRLTYKLCSVCNKWLTFSNFKTWMIEQDWKDKELDKDILIPGNKQYGPDTCLFVSRQVNGLLVDCRETRGEYPQGVNLFKRDNKFRAMCQINGRRKFLGYYGTPEEAASVYNHAKAKEIRRVAHLQTDIRIKNGLLRHAELRLNA